MVSTTLHYIITRAGVIVILIPLITAMILKFAFEIAIVISIVLVSIYYILVYIFVLSKGKDFDKIKKE